MLRAALMLWWLCWSAVAQGAPPVAVLYFHNQGNPELEPLKVGLAQMLTTDLQRAELVVVERQQLQAVLDELELGHGGIADNDTAARIGRLLGARYLVLGSYFGLMGTLRIDLRVVDTETGRIHYAHGVDGQAPDFLQMERTLAQPLVTAVRALPEPEVQPGAPRPTSRALPTRTEAAAPAAARPAVLTPDPEALDAAVQYSRGLIHLDRKELARAREAFQAAVAQDPQLADARQALDGLDL